MRKNFKYRLSPTPMQIAIFEQTLSGCCWLYNYFLEQRKTAYETEKKSLSRYDQNNMLKVLRREYSFLSNIHSHILQDVSTRIDLAFRSFFRRVKSGDKPGYPRFKGKLRYNSFTYPQHGFKFLEDIVFFSKIGSVKIKLHRPIEGTIKTCTLKRVPTGKWFVIFSCDIEVEPAKQSIEPVIGIDVGLKKFATFSNGDHVENPRFFRQEEKALAKVSRKLSTQKKGTPERSKARRAVARVYERISNKRHNFVHQLSHKLINEYNTICTEDLPISKMKKSGFRGLNKSICDAAWRMFLDFVEYKAEYAGKRQIKVNPAYTSQDCSRCGTRQELKMSDRVYYCPCCGLRLNRDHNAALNIRSLGLQTLVQA